jgi:predicted PurR-regulated permease PerM
MVDRPETEQMPAWVPGAIKLGRNALIVAGVAGGIALIVLVWLAGHLEDVFTIFATALFLSFALEPATTWLARHGWRRGSATGLMFLILIGVVVAMIALVVPAVIQGFQQLFASAPELVDSLARWLAPLGIELSQEKLVAEIRSNSEELVQSATAFAGGILGIATSILGGVFRWATIGLFTFYLVAEGPRARRALLSRFPPGRQQRLLFVYDKAIEQTGGYFYSRLLLAVINGFGMYLVLRLTNVPFAAPLAIFGGLISEFIPIVGTYIGGAIPIMVAALTSLSAGLWALAYVLVYQQVENYVLSPRLTARTMSLHPAVAFAAVMVGGAVGGFLAAFLALPAAGIIQAVIGEYSRSYAVISDELTQEPPPRPPKPKMADRLRTRRHKRPEEP